MKRLFQLRVGLSPLRHHKKRHNFKDTMSEMCRCEMSIETTKHFLVYCDFYGKKQHVSCILESNHLSFPMMFCLLNSYFMIMRHLVWKIT